MPERAARASALHQRRKERRRRKAASFISQPTPLQRPVVLIVPFVAAVVLETISVKREPSADASIGISMGPPRRVSVSAGVPVCWLQTAAWRRATRWKSAPGFTKRRRETRNLKDQKGGTPTASLLNLSDLEWITAPSLFTACLHAPIRRPLLSRHAQTHTRSDRSP